MTLGRQTSVRLLAALVAATCLPTAPAPADDASGFARWEREVAALERRDREHPPPRNAVLFVGSSSIRLWDLGTSFPGLGAVNHGFGGSQLADAAHFVPRLVLPPAPRLVVLYAGDNDLAAGKSPRQVADDFRAFVAAVRAGLPDTPVLFLSIKPSPQRWRLADKAREANALVEAACKKGERLRYVDVSTPLLGDDGRPRPDLYAADGLHLNAKGYAVWAATLKPYLK